jgi:hypothetical protein
MKSWAVMISLTSVSVRSIGLPRVLLVFDETSPNRTSEPSSGTPSDGSQWLVTQDLRNPARKHTHPVRAACTTGRDPGGAA